MDHPSLHERLLVFLLGKLLSCCTCFFPPILDPFDGAKPCFLRRGQKSRAGSTLSKPWHLCRGAEGLTIL